MRIVLLGAPGSGKGTQGSKICEHFGIPAISTGDMLRASIAAKTEVGLRAKAFMDEGNLVPDDIILEMMADRLREDDCKSGYLLDGFPRNIAQAEALEQVAGLESALLIDVSDGEIEKRMTGRRVCKDCGRTFHLKSIPSKVAGICDSCGGALIQRDDDSADTVRARLCVYHEQTEPLVEFYRGRGILKIVDGTIGLENVTSEVFEKLGARG